MIPHDPPTPPRLELCSICNTMKNISYGGTICARCMVAQDDTPPQCETQGAPTCKRCHGVGRRSYSTTATWRGGIGGCMITEGVCDRCWGSGDEQRPYASWREIEALRQRLSDTEAQLEGLRDAIAPYRHTPEDMDLWTDDPEMFVKEVRDLRGLIELPQKLADTEAQLLALQENTHHPTCERCKADCTHSGVVICDACDEHLLAAGEFYRKAPVSPPTTEWEARALRAEADLAALNQDYGSLLKEATFWERKVHALEKLVPSPVSPPASQNPPRREGHGPDTGESMRTIKIGSGAPAKKGKCPVRPPLTYTERTDGTLINPMAFCAFTKGHTGKHSWELPAPTPEDQ